jgi:hypothetical protein
VSGTPKTDSASVTYTSTPYTGADSFVYRVSDGTLSSDATVSITVTAAPPYRAFTATSEWNKPLPTDPTIKDVDSDAIIAELMSYGTDTGDAPTLNTNVNFAQPIFWGYATDPVYTIVPTGFGPTLTGVHIPSNAQAASGSDSQFTVFDMAKGVVIKLAQATWNGSTWVAGNTAEFDLSSNGLDCHLPESDRVCPMNSGHRGYPPALHAVRYDEVAAGVIQHTLKVALYRTGECAVYPGYGNENNRWIITDDGQTSTEEAFIRDNFCEGTIIRIKPDIDLTTKGLTPGTGPYIVAKAMQDYGLVFGDTSGNANQAMTLKMENLSIEGRSETWADFGITDNVLVGHLTFNDFIVMPQGFHR